MASVEDHYENLLASYYSWICGGSEVNLKQNRAFFQEHGIGPRRTGVAVDLGAGSGFQSIPLAEAGFKVISIDSNHELLSQLKKKANDLPIVTIQDNLLNFDGHTPSKVDVMVCMGDTLTHLDNPEDVQCLIGNVYSALEQDGLLILGFRDLTIERKDLDRFILVRSEPKRIFTCFLEFEQTHVKVHDIIYEQTRDQWHLKKSYFRKLRIGPRWLREALQEVGFSIEFYEVKNGMITLLAYKR